MQQVLIVIGY